MQFIVLAGVKAPVFGEVKKILEREGEGAIEVVGRGEKVSTGYYYTPSRVQEVIENVKAASMRFIAAERTAYLALIFVPHGGHDILLGSFAPSALGVQLAQDLNSRSERAAIGEILRGVRRFQRRISALNTLFSSRIRRTAWALPFINYQVGSFQENLRHASNLGLEEAPDEFPEPALPTRTILSPKCTVYSDERGILFVPAKRRNFHGITIAEENTGAWLKGAFRLGRSLPAGFHYDAKPERPPLSRFTFFDCEAGAVVAEGRHDYANITPNDRVRFGSRT